MGLNSGGRAPNKQKGMREMIGTIEERKAILQLGMTT
jgi:hypothetical protein